MFSLKYFVAQGVIVSIVFVAYFWCKEIGICGYLSEIVFASTVTYFVIFWMYRREVVKRAEDEKKSFNRASQPWD